MSKQSKLVEHLNKTRNNVFKKHYKAAIVELEYLMLQKPCEKIFYIYSGCETYDLALKMKELLSVDFEEVEVLKNGIFFRNYCLKITLNNDNTDIKKIIVDNYEQDNMSEDDESSNNNDMSEDDESSNNNDMSKEDDESSNKNDMSKKDSDIIEDADMSEEDFYE